MEKARASLVPVVTSSAAEPRRGGLARRVRTSAADLLDQVEQRPALLPGEGLTEQRAEPADVGAQRGVGAVGGVGCFGHRALLSSSTEDSAVRLPAWYRWLRSSRCKS